MNRINIIGVIGWDVEEESTINQINASTGDLEIFIASAGGYIFPGISILNAIREYNKGEVTAIVSFAASMGTQIALACDKVKVFDNAPFMIHNASGIAWGDYREMERYGEYLKRLNQNLGKLYSKKSNKPIDEILSLMDDETWYFGEEIVENGFADEVIGYSEDDVQDDDTVLKLAKQNIEKAEQAMAEEHLSAEDFAKAYKKCFNGQCETNNKDENLGVNPAKVEALAKNQNLTKGNVMTEEELQALNIEHAEALTSATADAQKLERTRTSGIIALGGNAEFTQKSIDDGLSVGDAAIALLKENASTIQTKKTDFEKAADEVNEIKLSKDDGEDLTGEQLAQKQADEALKNYGGKK